MRLLDVILAATSGEDIGKNIGQLLTEWATWLYGGVTAIVAIVFLANRRFAELAVFVGAAIVVGGFIFDPHGVADAVRGIWHSVTG